jgi:hypothetical protein
VPGLSTDILERRAESIAKIISEPLSGQRDRNLTLAAHENGKGTNDFLDKV